MSNSQPPTRTAWLADLAAVLTRMIGPLKVGDSPLVADDLHAGLKEIDRLASEPEPPALVALPAAPPDDALGKAMEDLRREYEDHGTKSRYRRLDYAAALVLAAFDRRVVGRTEAECPRCHGRGEAPFTPFERPCSLCHGTGTVPRPGGDETTGGGAGSATTEKRSVDEQLSASSAQPAPPPSFTPAAVARVRAALRFVRGGQAMDYTSVQHLVEAVESLVGKELP